MNTEVNFDRFTANAVDAEFQQGLSLQRQGYNEQAAGIYQRILQVQPGHAGALHLLGMIALESGDARSARELIHRSIDVDPSRAEPHADLGSALHELGMLPEALASYDRALELKPMLVPALHNRGNVLSDLERFTEAVDSFDRVIAQQPHLISAHYGRALALMKLHRSAEALASYDEALRLAPHAIETLNNRGIALLELKRPEEALASFEDALALDPRSSKALNNRGNALRTLQRQEEAVANFDRALEIDPTSFEAHRNRGGALRELQRSEEAVVSFDAALRLRPDCTDTLRDRVMVLIDLKRYAEATESLAQLELISPDIDYARGLGLYMQRLQCDWSFYEQKANELVEAVRAGKRADYPFPFIAVTDSAAAQLRCAQAFAADKYPAAEKPMWAGGRPYRHDRIRVAYVSSDLRFHVVSCLLAGVFERHDRARFDVIAVSLRPEEQTPMGQRVRSAFNTFVDVSQKSDREVAALIRELEIDIAVDLTGFTKGARTGILAQRPAPVQVHYLGFPGTMGAAYFDYLVADPFVIPEVTRPHYAERVVYLPDCFQANDDQRVMSDLVLTRRDLSLPEAALVLCCHNNSTKINPPCFDIWMRVLSAVPGSVLWLLADTPAVEFNLRAEARARGVDPHRLVFASRVGYPEHLRRLQFADLFLDTAPFNGGITTSDALWAGLPVLTLAGEAYAARMAGSLLTGLGLPELITNSPQEYEAMALTLARSPAMLSALRAKLARNKATSPVFDTTIFCRHLEWAYTRMWERAERGEAPESFAVPRLPAIGQS